MSMSTEQAANHPPEAPRRRTSGMVLICAAVIVVMLAGGSMFWLAHRGLAASTHSNKARPTATISPTWTPTAITPPVLALFYDTFLANNHGWSLGSNGGYFRILVNNSLILSDSNPNSTLVEAVPISTNLDNYVVSADFMFNQGDGNDSVGFYIRGDSTLDHDYRIDVNGNNTLDIARETLDENQSQQTSLLVPSTRSEYLNPPGKMNTLTVFMIGPAITVEINNVVVMTTEDPSYTNGQVALFTRHGATSQGVTVSFTRVEIDRLFSRFNPPPTPTPSLTPTATAGHP